MVDSNSGLLKATLLNVWIFWGCKKFKWSQISTPQLNCFMFHKNIDNSLLLTIYFLFSRRCSMSLQVNNRFPRSHSSERHRPWQKLSTGSWLGNIVSREFSPPQSWSDSWGGSPPCRQNPEPRCQCQPLFLLLELQCLLETW